MKERKKYAACYNINVMTSSQLACYLNWLERCTGIAEVRARIPASVIFSGFLHKLR